MAVTKNTVLSQDVADSLSIEAVNSFRGEYDRLSEVLQFASVETRPAGAAINQFKVTGALNENKDDTSSSGDSYVEGDVVALSKYSLEKVPFGEMTVKPYRKATSADAVLKAGLEKAVIDTDKKMILHMRAKVVDNFFKALANGTAVSDGQGLQATLAMADAKLYDALETNNDATEGLVHVISRQDVAQYLSDTTVDIQTLFGLNYLEDFLGIEHVLITNKVAAGTLYVTPRENIKVYGLDFSALSNAGLAYQTDADGLIGVAHTAEYDNVSVQTHAIMGAMFVPQVKDYIVKATVKPQTKALGK